MRLALAFAALLLAGCLEGPRAQPDVDLKLPPVETPTLPSIPTLPTGSTPTPTPAPAPTPAAGLRNGGFENGTEGWTLEAGEGSHASVDCESASAGACSLRLGHAGRGVSARQDVPAGNARAAFLSYKTRDPAQLHRGSTWFSVTLYALDAQGAIIEDGRMVWDESEGYDEFRTDSIGSQVPAGAATVRVLFAAGPSVEGAEATGDAATWVDDVVLTLSPFPGPSFRNGGFEAGRGDVPEDWGFGTGVSRDCALAHGGLCSLRINGATTGAGFAPENDTIRIALWVRGGAADEPLVINATFFRESSALGYLTGTAAAPGETWTRVVLPPGAVPEGTQKVSLHITAALDAPWWIDDVDVAWGS